MREIIHIELVEAIKTSVSKNEEVIENGDQIGVC